MKHASVAAVSLLAGFALTPGLSQAQGDMAQRLMREGSRGTFNSSQNSFLAGACYATAVNNRGEGLTANAARLDAEGRIQVTVRTRGDRVIAVVVVTPTGTGSAAELFARPRSFGNVEGFRRFLAERC